MAEEPASDAWPVTLEEAVERLLTKLSEADRELVRTTDRARLAQYHFDWGMGIRNAFGLWAGNHALKASCGSAKMHTDDASMVIIEGVWCRLNGLPASAARIENWQPPHNNVTEMGVENFCRLLYEKGARREFVIHLIESYFYLDTTEANNVWNQVSNKAT